LYPNPWPKPDHLQRRWHGSPLWPSILALGGRLELRSNWRVYVDEFAQALALTGASAQLEICSVSAPLTPFERKYQLSGQTCWRCISELQAVEVSHDASET
jgi:tRNA G46 methylase TrmB